MGRSRTARHPRPRPEEIPADDQPQDEQFTLEPANDNQPSKASIVREAMDKGMDDLDDIAGYAKDTYGVEIKRAQISAYKSQARNKGRDGEPRRRNSPATASIPPTFGEDVRSIKELLEQAGGVESLTEQANAIIALHQKYGEGLMSLIRAFG